MSVLIGFILTLFLTLLRIKDFILWGRVDVRLTKDIFFRITDKGESLFSNAVLLIRNGSIEIRAVGFKLCRISGSKKEYQVEPIWYGEKIRTKTNPIADHHFYGRSPLDLIISNNVKRSLYWAVLQEYSDGISQYFNQLQEKSYELRRKFKEKRDKGEDPENYSEWLKIEAIKLTNYVVEEVMKKTQLEEGTYRLSINVNYKQMGFWNRWILKSSSEIEFEVESHVRDKFKVELEMYVLPLILSIVTDGDSHKDFPIRPNPEYAPIKIREL